MAYRPRVETGQGIVEFVIVLAIVVVFVVIILALIGPQVGNVFSGGVQSL